MTKEIELKRLPIEGLVAIYPAREPRDAHMANYITRGFEVQPWRSKIKGDWRYGFSYYKTYRLTLKQKKELKKLEEQETLVSIAILGIQFRRALKEMQDDIKELSASGTYPTMSKEEYEQREWCPEGLEEKKGGTK